MIVLSIVFQNKVKVFPFVCHIVLKQGTIRVLSNQFSLKSLKTTTYI